MVTKKKEKTPWYLKKGWVYAMCFITPPIGLINVLLHQNRWKPEDKHLYLGIALVMGLLWILKFFPWWVNIGYILLAFFVINMWPEKPKSNKNNN